MYNRHRHTFCRRKHRISLHIHVNRHVDGIPSTSLIEFWVDWDKMDHLADEYDMNDIDPIPANQITGIKDHKWARNIPYDTSRLGKYTTPSQAQRR